MSSVLEELEKLHTDSKSIRGRFESDWLLNVAFYAGEQWLFWNNGRLDRVQVDKHRPLVTDNRIMPAINMRLAKLTKNRPVWVGTPSSGGEDDVNSAALAERAMEFEWDHLNVRKELDQALHWAEVCSAGFLKVYWDSHKGKSNEVIIGPDGQPMLDDSGRPLRADQFGGTVPEDLKQLGVKTKTIAEGDLCVESRSPFNIATDPLAESLDDAEWLIDESVRSTEYVLKRYGVEMEGDADATPGLFEAKLFRQGQGSTSYKGIRVKELWAKPSSKHPKGRYVVWAKQQVLYEGPLPYDFLPYVMLSGIPVPGRFWPSSMVDQLRGPQVELNKVKSQIAENAQRIGNPALLENTLANVKYTGVPGERVRFDGTVPDSIPSYLQPPEMPIYVREQVDRIESSIMEISGQHEVTSGQVPNGVTAASAINLLQEQDDTRLGPQVTAMEEALSRLGSMALKLLAMFCSTDRIMLIAGEDGDWDPVTFKGEMLGENTHVRVQAGSAFPRSKAAKQAAMQENLNLLLQYGVPVKPRDMRKFLRDYEVGGLERLFGGMTEDEQQTNRENRRLSQGIALQINPFDEDEVHIEAHEEFQKSSRFERLDPGIKQLFQMHVDEHRKRLIASMGPPPMEPTPILPEPPKEKPSGSQ